MGVVENNELQENSSCTRMSYVRSNYRIPIEDERAELARMVEMIPYTERSGTKGLYNGTARDVQERKKRISCGTLTREHGRKLGRKGKRENRGCVQSLSKVQVGSRGRSQLERDSFAGQRIAISATMKEKRFGKKPEDKREAG